MSAVPHSGSSPRPSSSVPEPAPHAPPGRAESRAGPRPLGAHMSIAGGFVRAVDRARRVGADALQIFTKNQVQWRAAPPAPEQIAAFHHALGPAGIRFVCAHAGYLINPASPSARVRALSRQGLETEIRRADALGCACLVMHPGSPKDEPASLGLERVAETLKAVLEATADCRTALALENTAGQGRTLGADFAQLAELLDRLGGHPRLWVCLDTCHAFAAGYDLRTPQAVRAFTRILESTVAIGRIRVLHLNDSRGECGSRLDRHEHVGQGRIGEAGFAALLAEPRLKGIPGIIETPKDPKSLAEDQRNLAVLRRLESRAQDGENREPARAGAPPQPGIPPAAESANGTGTKVRKESTL